MVTRRRVLLTAGFVAAIGLAVWAADFPPVPASGNVVEGQVNITDAGALKEPNLSRVVVYLGSHPQLDEPPPAGGSWQVSQRNKMFVPDLLVIPKGSEVEFPNWDPFSHNVFSRSRAASFDLGRYPQGQSKRYKFDTAGTVRLFCNIHPQMKAVIVVVPNRFYTQADAQGRFTLKDVPAGRYSIVATHERYGEQLQEITVAPNQPTQISLNLKQESTRQSVTRRHQRRRYGVERGLGVKRERLGLPVIEDAHPANRR